MNRPTKVIASAFGLTAFAVAVIAGMAVGNPTDSVLWHAIVAMLLCQVIGLVIGSIGERVVNEAVLDYQRRHPIPSTSEQPIMVAEVVDDDASPERSAA